jgi:hypothetical protein
MESNSENWQEVIQLILKFKEEPTPENRIKICDRLYQYEQEILSKPQLDEINGITNTDKKNWQASWTQVICDDEKAGKIYMREQDEMNYGGSLPSEVRVDVTRHSFGVVTSTPSETESSYYDYEDEEEQETFEDWFNSFDECSKHNILNMMDS